MAGNLSIEQRKWIFNLDVKLTNVNIWEEPSILYYILCTYFWPTLYIKEESQMTVLNFNMNINLYI